MLLNRPVRPRKIIHIDMDAFYASVEQRDSPELRGKPIAVGSSSGRGVVMTASYEARKFGVRSAMPSVTAMRLCPDLIFVASRMDVYREVSQQVREIFYRYTHLVEPLSLDEAYLDVTDDRQAIGSATLTADKILAEIKAVTQLTASAGVSYNKFLAKIASDLNKPNGKAIILPEQAAAFLESLPVRKFHGVGKVTAEKMYSLGIRTGADLKAVSLEFLIQQFGKVGRYYYHVVRGTDERPVRPDRPRKSVSAETTFSENKQTSEELRAAISQVAERLMKRIERAEAKGYTVTLKIKYADFEIVSRSLTQSQPVTELSAITEIASLLLKSVKLNRPVRLLGIGISKLEVEESVERDVQLSFDF